MTHCRLLDGNRECPRGQAGFSLIEVTIALSVAAIVLLAILGLLQTGLTSQRATIEQTAATSLTTMIYSDILAGAGTNVSPRFKIDLASSTSPQTIYFNEAGKATGTIGTASTADSRYRVSLAVNPPASGAKGATGVRILVTWPAAADAVPGQWPARQTGSLDTWTAVDRN